MLPYSIKTCFFQYTYHDVEEKKNSIDINMIMEGLVPFDGAPSNDDGGKYIKLQLSQPEKKH